MLASVNQTIAAAQAKAIFMGRLPKYGVLALNTGSGGIVTATENAAAANAGCAIFSTALRCFVG